MDSAVGKVVFCSISRRERVLYSYNGGDSSVDSLARLCLARAPPFHSHYFHTTAARRTFAFLFLPGPDLTYLLIIDHPHPLPPSSNPRILTLLHQIHHGFTTGRDELVTVVRTLVRSTEESMKRCCTSPEDHHSNNNGGGGPLLPAEVSLEVEPDPDHQHLLLQKRRSARGLWWRHAKVVVAVDAAVCGVLFGVWMAVCRGFRCVS